MENKVIIVTGASEGIGRALCLELAHHKGIIVGAARNKKRLNELREEIEGMGREMLVVPTDVTEEKACKNLIETTIARFGRLDILVHNAGRTIWTTCEDISDTSIFEKVMRLNYFGSVYCTYYALPYIKESKGQIVGVSSIAGIAGIPSRTAYSASKHAMFGFFDSLRIELAGSGVKVTMVAPDFVLSEIHKRALDGNGKPLDKSPLQESKIMTAKECAVIIVKGIEKQERLVITSLRGKVGRWLKVLAPSLLDKIAAKGIRDRK